jgi:hypothetical protein
VLFSLKGGEGMTLLEAEMWKDIAGYEGLYQISNFGNVKSLPKKKGCGIGYTQKERVLKAASNGQYLFVVLRKDRKSKMHYVHRLVAQAFIANPNNKSDINHLNGKKTDNRVSNLEWATRQENIIHAYKNGLEKPHTRKILQYDKRGNLIKEWNSIKDAAAWLNKPRTNISHCCRGNRYKSAYGYVWKYKDVRV